MKLICEHVKVDTEEFLLCELDMGSPLDKRCILCYHQFIGKKQKEGPVTEYATNGIPSWVQDAINNAVISVEIANYVAGTGVNLALLPSAGEFAIHHLVKMVNFYAAEAKRLQAEIDERDNHGLDMQF